MILRRKLSTFGLLEAGRSASEPVSGHRERTAYHTLNRLWQRLEIRQSALCVPVGRGNTVCINLDDSRATEIKLASHRFWLRGGVRPALLGSHELVHSLHQGKNVIGREKHNDIVIDARHRHVSDKHLLVEYVAREQASLTDLSNKGTFVPHQCVV